MALFGKGKRGKHADEEIEEIESVEAGADSSSGGRKGRKQKKPREKKRNEMLSSVLRETVFPQVASDLRENKNFVVQRNGESLYVGMFLDVADIGGLSKKTNRDEDKGTIIECLNSGEMKVLITPRMMEEERIMFVPDDKTLDLMSEFQILRDAPYKTMFVSEDGGKIDLSGAVDITFEDATKILSGKKPIREFLREGGCEWAAGGTVPSAMPWEDVSEDDSDIEFLSADDVPADRDDVVEDLPSISAADLDGSSAAGQDSAFAVGNAPVFEDIEISDVDIEPETVPSPSLTQAIPPVTAQPAQPQAASVQQAAPAPQPQAQAAPVAQTAPAPEPEPEPQVVTKDEFDVQIARRFFSTELGLEFDYTAFDEQFGTQMEYRPFEENRPDGWLNAYLNEMSIEANNDLTNFHANNLKRLRRRYGRLMAGVVENTARLYGTQSENVPFTAQREQAAQVRDAERASVEQKVSIRKAELREEFNAAAEEAAEAAAMRARSDYRTRNQKRLDHDIASLDEQYATDVETHYANTIREIDEMRREAAHRRMDYGVTAAIDEISKEYAKMLAAEELRYEQHRQLINDWLDSNRKNEVAYTEALTEEHRQQEHAQTVRAEYSQRIREMQIDYEERRMQLENDMKDMETRHASALSEMDAKQARALSDLRDENERLRAREAQLLDRIENMDESKAEEFKHQLAMADDAKRAAEKRLDELMEGGQRQNKQNTVVWIALAVVFAAAMLCVGILIGFSQTVSHTVSTTGCIDVAPIVEVEDAPAE